MTNILQAINTIINNPIPDLVSYYQSKSQNKINAIGEALEEFIKDVFADTISETDTIKKSKKYEQVFSHQGSQNNPPDLMIKNGDAIEVKKINKIGSGIALNSSYPTAKLYQDSPMITADCRNCETWTEKDIIYAIGCTPEQKLRLLWFVYGDCYAASKETYKRISQQIAIGVNQIPNVVFSKTKELGKVNQVDPLKITDLRIRGMWSIKNPLKVYKYINLDYDNSSQFQLNVVMRQTKYLSFPEKERIKLESLSKPGFSIADNKIKCPDNPCQLIPVKIISYKLI
ncbi:Type II site-specific deoxyribonuclease [Crinalium epipsammum PCC 9333]|uniref:Type II site-specific deoxyribonuclease n=1 Tax=Crinalium epipsammum PCC 9333 TaxID=1173022 RepID=K9VY48_9CYAN|nr:NgoPII family restriction endonuclease [Crinalium epipsammum]AFZ13028.1 Type II site-specific deoxyribonuclease [Crinalium epipsammum PCC 9333]